MMMSPKSCLILLSLVSLATAAAFAPNGQQVLVTVPTKIHGQSPLAAPVDSRVKQDKIRKKLQNAEIIPTVIDDFIPSLALAVTWPHHHTRASLGNTLKPKHLQDAPSISLHPHHSHGGYSSNGLCSYYRRHENLTHVITLTDPDAPSRKDPKWSEMCHWIASANIEIPSFSSLGDGDDECDDVQAELKLTELTDVVPYKPPGPPEKTGRHRYVFLVFVAANGTSEALNLTKPGERRHWGYDGPGEGDDDEEGKTHGVRDWAEENGLVAVGANFIYAKNKKQ